MDEQPLITRWDEAETWLQAEAHDCATRRRLPPSVAIAFHQGRLSALIETPTFTVEDADLITDELCRFLPQLHPDQLLLIWPAGFSPDGKGMPTLWTLKAQLGERDRGWRTLLYPLPFDEADAPVDPLEIESNDPWSKRIHRVFAAVVPPVHDTIVVTPSDHRFTVAFHPDGPFGEPTPLFGYN